MGLSVMARGTMEEKLRWTFTLYDINGDGQVTKEECKEIAASIFDLMGKIADPSLDEALVYEKVEKLFEKMDLNHDGVLTLDEFLTHGLHDEDMKRSMAVFDNIF